MIEVGDLVRVKGRSDVNAGVFLVLKKGQGRYSLSDKDPVSMTALCAQGSKKVWLYVRQLEKL